MGIRVFLFALLATAAIHADSITLNLRSSDAKAVLEWESHLNLPLAGTLPEYKVEWSSDLEHWQALGAPISGATGVGDELIRHAFTRPAGNVFYRVSAAVAVSEKDRDAEGMYGYSAEFNRNLQSLGQIPLTDFVQSYSITNEYRAALSFDPTTARFWADFNIDPAIWNSTNTAEPRFSDFRFNAEEMALFRTNGFVVSERLGSYSFADAFYRIYFDDLPLFISSDALLHAWHRAYVSVLAEIEASFLAARLGSLVTNLSAQIPALQAEARGAPLEAGVLDADFCLAVAKSLLGGTNDPGQLNQASRVNEAMSAIDALAVRDMPLFGSPRMIDFSQFRVRGHYADSPQLQKYFRAMKWCGLIDFRFRGFDSDSMRQFSGAAALTVALDRANQRAEWQQFDDVIRTFVGLPDCMTVGQLGDLLTAGNLAAPFNQLNTIYSNLWSGALGVQDIRSGYFYWPFGPEQSKLPRSFALMPERFVVDSWAFSKVVFDDIIWDENGIPEFKDKVARRIPSSLDVAFSVFGNDQVVPEISARIADPNGRRWRDGLPYQHNLAAVRDTVDGHMESYWTNNIYTAWLGCLRALSEPTATPEYPDALQTHAFAQSALNTQLASWTELRHDTILYAKQSSTAGTMCSYPAGYVEPRPEFWRRLGAMAQRTADLLQTVPNEGNKSVLGPWGLLIPTAQLKTNWTALFERFVSASAMLQSIAEKELAHVELDDAQVQFIENTIEQHAAYASGQRSYGGWYPKLFYKPIEHNLEWGLREGSDLWNPVVTDVHTDIPDEYTGDPGLVLHQAVGNVNMAFIVVNCGNETPIMYAGPVMSHYEFELGPTTRQTDDEWKTILKNKQQPAPPAWTKSFLVPGGYTVPPNVN